MVKTCILAIQRNERDIFEWIDYHLYKVGFDHIFIIDTNDLETPLVVHNDRVTVVHKDFNLPECVHYSKFQALMYDEQISRLCHEGYEWCAIIDIDEYIDVKNETLQEYINRLIEQRIDHSELMWENYTDNGLLFNSKANVDSSYSQKIETTSGFHDNEFNWGKSIFRLDYGMTSAIHAMNDHVYPDGKHIAYIVEDRSVAVVRHYRTKCLSDFLDKIAFRKFKQSETSARLGGVVNTYIYYNGVNKDVISNFAVLADMKGITLSPRDLQKLDELKKEFNLKK